MQIIEMQLQKFFQDYLDPYWQRDVEIIYNPDGSIHLSCDVPGLVLENEDLTVNLLSDHKTLADFAYEYLITTLDDLKLITQELMYKMFLVGRCDLQCYLDSDCEYFLFFRRNGDLLIATDAEAKQHEVPLSVKTPEEIVIYTQHYYEKLFA